MRKIGLSAALATLLLAYTGTTTKLEAWELTSPSTWIGDKETYESITFNLLYPVPFYKTGAFKWTAVAVVAVVGTGVSIATWGATSVPFATALGGLLAGGGSGAWAAGLATLGGGTLASGGFGMAGGAFVIGTITDLSLVGLGSFMPEDNTKGKNYTTIKIPLPQVGSEQTLNTYEQIEELTEKLMDGKIEPVFYEKQIYNYYIYASENLNPQVSSYDLINGAILTYNLGDFKKSQEYLDRSKVSFGVSSSFINYMQALLNLVNNNSAGYELNLAIAQEPKALNPYLLKIQIAMDEDRLSEARRVVDEGLDNYDDDNYQLNYLGGIILYRQGNYKGAIDYFKDALSNTTINEIEAETKMLIAKCYKKDSNSKKADKWYMDALSEVDDDDENGQKYINKLVNLYSS